MPFWKKRQKRQTTAKPKTNTASSKQAPKQEPKTKPKPTLPPPKPKPDIPKKPATAKKEIKPQDAKKEFLRVFKQLTYRHRAWDIWRDFIIMFACSLSNPLDKSHYDEREKRYMRIIKKYNKQEQNLFPELAAHTVMALEENPEQDFLGGIFMELNLGNGSNGQFFTPYHVCDLMAKIAMNENMIQEVKEKGYITINDSCCGAGATLIAGIHEAKRQLEKENLNYQNHVLVVAQDIDETVALMCYIQLSLLGVAAYIKIGNTFTEPISSDDTTENYWFTPIYFSDVWVTRRLVRKMDSLLKGDGGDGTRTV